MILPAPIPARRVHAVQLRDGFEGHGTVPRRRAYVPRNAYDRESLLRVVAGRAPAPASQLTTQTELPRARTARILSAFHRARPPRAFHSARSRQTSRRIRDQ